MAEGSEAPGESFFQWAARLFDPANRHAKPEALRGIRVLDLSVIIFGPATAEYTLLLYHGSREVRERLGGMDIAVSVYTFVPVKDGWAFIAGYTDPNFGAICRIMGRPELAQDPRFRTTLDRTQPDKRAALRDEIARWSVNFTASEILAKVLADPGPGTVVFGPVNSPTATLAESHWWERGCFARLDDPVYGPLTLAAPAWRMTRTPPRLKVPGRPAGYHTAHVYARHLGLGPKRLGELRARGVV